MQNFRCARSLYTWTVPRLIRRRVLMTRISRRENRIRRAAYTPALANRDEIIAFPSKFGKCKIMTSDENQCTVFVYTRVCMYICIVSRSTRVVLPVKQQIVFRYSVLEFSSGNGLEILTRKPRESGAAYRSHYSRQFNSWMSTRR